MPQGVVKCLQGTGPSHHPGVEASNSLDQSMGMLQEVVQLQAEVQRQGGNIGALLADQQLSEQQRARAEGSRERPSAGPVAHTLSPLEPVNRDGASQPMGS